jgi:hypothetical protein
MNTFAIHMNFQSLKSCRDSVGHLFGRSRPLQYWQLPSEAGLGRRRQECVLRCTRDFTLTSPSQHAFLHHSIAFSSSPWEGLLHRVIITRQSDENKHIDLLPHGLQNRGSFSCGIPSDPATEYTYFDFTLSPCCLHMLISAMQRSSAHQGADGTHLED